MASKARLPVMSSWSLLHRLFRCRRTQANDNSWNHYPIAWLAWKESSTQTATRFALSSKTSRAARCSTCNVSIIRRRSARLSTAADLDEYTYLVAGCVGEFWTRLCFRHVRQFSSRTEDEMLALGKRYGMALQLINVLRDAGADLRAGRCYFPEHELSAVHLTPSQILSEPERFQPIYRTWLENAKAGLSSGMEYSRGIKNRRVRAATVLPALIGARTLALLNASGPAALQRTVKVPRSEVRAMILSLGLTFASGKRIDAMFARAKL